MDLRLAWHAAEKIAHLLCTRHRWRPPEIPPRQQWRDFHPLERPIHEKRARKGYTTARFGKTAGSTRVRSVEKTSGTPPRGGVHPDLHHNLGTRGGADSANGLCQHA